MDNVWQIFKNGQTGVILRGKIRRVSTGNGYTGLSGSSSGLVISTIADNEATATAYTSSLAIQTISTLGTYSAPSPGACRFGQVDATHHPGLYELQFADARFAVPNAKALWVTVSGVTDMIEADGNIPLWVIDPYNPNSIADNLFYRDTTQTKVAMGNAEPPRRSLMNAMRPNLNRRDTTSLVGFLSVFQEDDATVAFRQGLTTDSGAQLITVIGP